LDFDPFSPLLTRYRASAITGGMDSVSPKERRSPEMCL
jgi:hypothetical protein